jgi:hypothetical protein
MESAPRYHHGFIFVVSGERNEPVTHLRPDISFGGRWLATALKYGGLAADQPTSSFRPIGVQSRHNGEAQKEESALHT